MLSGFVTLFVLSTLSLTFATATAGEGDVVSRLDGTSNPAPGNSGALTFEANYASTQLRRIDISEAHIPATVINLKLQDFQPLRLEVVDRQGNLVKTLADGLWAEGDHQMAWHHQNEEDEILEDGVYFVRLTPELAGTEGLALGR
jgi:hypothetical protein